VAADLEVEFVVLERVRAAAKEPAALGGLVGKSREHTLRRSLELAF
jgi:hypothetical protein